MNNKKITVKKILEICNGKLLSNSKDIEISNFLNDSRKIEAGDMYLGIKGERLDGNDFVEEALKNGAIGCIIDKEINSNIIENYKEKVIIKVDNTVSAIQKLAKYKRSLYDIPVVAVTGSVGKTSTKDIVASVLSQKYDVLKTEGNFNNHIGLPLTLLKLKNHTAIVLEMGMNHFGELALLTDIAKPTICVLTNIGTAHIGNLGSRENILKAKLEVLQGLHEGGEVLINNDNDLLNKWYKEDNNIYKIYTYGICNNSDYVAERVYTTEECSSFCINNIDIKIQIAGTHFIYNALSAYAIGDILKVDSQKIVKGIAEFKLTSNRMDIEVIKNNIKVINDTYNASYDSMKAVLEVMKKTKANRKIAVLGDMLELGQYSEELHKGVGEEVVRNNIDILITVGENAKNIAKRAKELNMKNIYVFNSIIETSAFLNKNIIENDLILLKASNSMNFNKIMENIKNN